MLPIGSRAPEFTLNDQDGTPTSLTALLNRGPLILYFYPADFTPGCTREACSIRDLHADILRAKLNVAGVSPQSPARHRDFRAAYQLPFPLLADQDKTVSRMYGALGMFGLMVSRVTYLIDPARNIRDAVHARWRISAHTRLIQHAIAISDGL